MKDQSDSAWQDTDPSGYRGIWVFAEQHRGDISEVTLELLGAARQLAEKRHGEVAAVLVGGEVEPLAEELFAHGADKVYLACHSSLDSYSTLPYARILRDVASRHRPEVFLFPATHLGADLAPRVAAMLRTGLSAHSTGLDITDDGQLLQYVPAFGGSVMATITCPRHRPQMATVRPGVMKKLSPNRRAGTVERVELIPFDDDNLPKVLSDYRTAGKVVGIEEADVVVAGGAGIGSAENWKLLERLAEVLGGAVGATRPAVDEGWALEDQMIGQSGKTVRPDLYIGVGISGVMQHLVGIQDARVIVAINNDPKAPIFEAADVGLVADFKDVLPLLIESLARR